MKKIIGVDPNLGYGYLRSEIKEFLIKGEKFENGVVHFCSEKERPLIAVLGGSTSDIQYDGSWVRPFAELVKGSFKVVSGAVIGYNTSQELIKLIRDIIPLRPDIVISFTGINDIANCQNVKFGNSFTPIYTFEFLKNAVLKYRNKPLPGKAQYILSKDKLELFDLSVGRTILDRDQTVFRQNLISMKSLCSAHNIRYLPVLQPTLGVGNYNMSEKEYKMLSDLDVLWRTERKLSYCDSLREFYEGISNIDLINFSDIFEKIEGCYLDARHPNSIANKEIATRMAQLVS